MGREGSVAILPPLESAAVMRSLLVSTRLVKSCSIRVGASSPVLTAAGGSSVRQSEWKKTVASSQARGSHIARTGASSRRGDSLLIVPFDLDWWLSDQSGMSTDGIVPQSPIPIKRCGQDGADCGCQMAMGHLQTAPQACW